ncbi:lysine exporter LysO family protein [Marinilabilia salmonicolor]|uniref:lysine exporter LysO family protein n=1 Tax=Marinilabilia salmonicolor TaxID=989 RepID=UPI0009DA4E5E|nr:lysine exporter LysO family protein [Marinilabilia salmonicolor]
MISLAVIGLFIVGIGIGLLLRKHPIVLKITEPLVSVAIFALLFFLGISVGTDDRVIQNITSLGWQAVLLSSGAILGSLILARLATSFFKEDKEEVPKRTKLSHKPLTPGWFIGILKNQSLWILLFFVAGTIGSRWGVFPAYWGDNMVATGTLYVMMILVGTGLGADPRALEILKRTSFRILLVPAIVIVGSIGGSLLTSFLLDSIDTANGMAIGAGFGYYSLSAIFIDQISGSEMGVIALLANIFREVITLLAAPLMVRWFGKLGAIVSGGATAMDTTLPVIVKATGKEYAVISIFSGIVLSILVPVLVPFILSS